MEIANGRIFIKLLVDFISLSFLHSTVFFISSSTMMAAGGNNFVDVNVARKISILDSGTQSLANWLWRKPLKTERELPLWRINETLIVGCYEWRSDTTGRSEHLSIPWSLFRQKMSFEGLLAKPYVVVLFLEAQWEMFMKVVLED